MNHARLTDLEIGAILDTLHAQLPASFKGQLLLFGSRALTDAKGGDIDLALIGESEVQIQDLKKIDYKVVAALKMNPAIGDQKIDLKILNVRDSESPFFQHALKNAIQLKFW